ncbi:MAG TPA: TAXI family TRAP transporter solute-binding subunit [Xanthobacteraceae bacterium]|jgi:uncharacterized protein|nr:TAXI family TRAP transporter solute-binding subunit [Xanthobacteraceae bacterium]
MQRISLAVLTLALSILFGGPGASETREQIRGRVNDNVLFLMGGQPGATFNQLANDIAAVIGSGNDLRVLSVDGGAAVENIEDVVYLRSIDMALTTQEAMDYLKSTGELGPHLENQLTYIAPLFVNPLHILARGGAKSIRDLSGKRVNFNNKGSATAQFVPNVFKVLGIDVQPFFMSQADALAKMRSGDLDATICSCPAPVPAYAAARPEWGFRFVSVPYEGPLRTSYQRGIVRNEDYPALVANGEPVDTIAASTVLVSYKWQKGTQRYDRMAKFVDEFFSKIYEFHKPPRSPLWKSVNVAATIPGWSRFPAAEEWLASWRAGRAKGQETDFKRFVSETAPNVSSTQTDQLFREFQIWLTKRKCALCSQN